MGNLTSTYSDPLEELRSQLKTFGDHYPFGDDEILRLSRCYAYLNHMYERANHQVAETTLDSAYNHEILTGRFLSDWATFCPSLPKADFKSSNTTYTNLLQVDPGLLDIGDDMRIQRFQRCRYELMTIIEENILPVGFGETLQRLLFKSSDLNMNHQSSSTEESYHIAMHRLQKFFSGAAECSRRGSRKALMVIFQCCQHGNEKVASAKELINLCYRLSLASATLTSCKDLEADSLMDAISLYFPQNMEESSLTKSLSEYNIAMNGNGHSEKPSDAVSMDSFIAWSESAAPCLSATLESFMHYIFFPDVAYPPSRTEFLFPDVRSQQNAFFPLSSRSSPLLFSFASMSPSLGGSWHRIFTTESDGLSFNRLQNSLLGYGGPTLLIIREVEGGGIFGAFTSTPWKESKDFYGNSDCFLYRISPTVKVYRPRGMGTNYMYCNSASRSKNYDGLSHGIGFGGNADKPRLYIAESFDGCMASGADLTFEAGALLPPPKTEGAPSNKFFEIESLEVWGVGGDEVVAEALGARNKQREVVAANIRKARKVDKAAFLDDFKSGLIESKAFQHREQMRGRDGCHAADEE